MTLNIRYAPSPSGTPVACVAVGAGTPLLVTPAGPWDALQVEWEVPPWRKWYQRIGAHATVLRYDERGTGLTRGEPDFTIEASVGLAVNDTARQVGFALGVGILGSVMSTVYGGQITDAAAGLLTVVTDSVGAAMHIAASLFAPAGTALVHAAGSAFIAGMGVATITGAGLAVVAAVLAAWRLPHWDAGHDPKPAREPTA